MATAPHKPLLDLTTVLDVHHMRIDGQTFFFRTTDRMSIGQLKTLEAAAPRLGELLKRAETLTADEDAEASHLLAATCAIALDAPSEVHARLTDVQRLSVMEAFTQLRSTPSHLAGARANGRNRTGVNTSRGSSASTAATRKPGSRGFHSR